MMILLHMAYIRGKARIQQLWKNDFLFNLALDATATTLPSNRLLYITMQTNASEEYHRWSTEYDIARVLRRPSWIIPTIPYDVHVDHCA